MDPVSYYYNVVARQNNFYNLYTSKRRGFNPESFGGLLLWFTASENVISDGAVGLNGGWLTLADNPNIVGGDRDISWAGWFRADALGGSYQTLFSKGSLNGYAVQIRSTDYLVKMNGGPNEAFGVGTPSAGNWFFTAFRFKSATDTLTIDINTQPYSWVCTTGLLDSGYDFSIGTLGGGLATLGGAVDSVGRWNRYLSDSEVSWLYNSAQGRIYSDLTPSLKTNLVLWWDFDELTGIRYDSHGSNNLTESSTLSGIGGIVAGQASTNDGVKNWLNKIDQSKYLNQATFASRPSYLSTGFSAALSVNFDGIDDNLKTTTTLPNAISTYSVIKQNTWANGNYLFDGSTGNSHALIQSGTKTGDIAINLGTSLTGCSGLGTGDFGIVTALYTQNTGYIQVNNFTALTGNIGTNTIVGFTLGSKGDDTKFSKIDVREILVYSGLHGIVERAVIKDYLSKLWGVTL